MSDGQLAIVKHTEADRERMLESLALVAFNGLPGRQSLLDVAFTRRPAILSPLKTAELIGDGRPAHVLQSDLHLKTAVLVPVANGEHVLGVTICLADSTGWYTPRRVRIVSELCDRFALAITAAKMYEACRIAVDAGQELMATTIHDLMSPLTYIKGSAQRLRRLDWSHTDQAMSFEVEKRLSAIDAAVTRMATALSGLRATTCAQPPTIDEPPGREITDLTTLAREVVGLEQLVATDHVLKLNAGMVEPLLGNWDAGQIQRMLANIISNAVKYSPTGSPIEIKLSSQVDDEGRWAVVSVTDRGIGIPAGDLPFVFEPFHRGSNVAGIAGTGLGLASAWQAVTTHNGRISVESEEGKGTCICVRLPRL
jgi:signal transduction histidine kinase